MDLLSIVAAVQAAYDIPIIGPFLQSYGLLIVLVWVADVYLLAPNLPAPTASSRLGYVILYRIANGAAGNVRHARNATDPKVKP